MFWVYAALAVSLVSFFVAAYFYNWVKKLPTANPKLDEVGALIREGAFTFLRREYRVLGLFSIIVMAVIFLFFPQPVWAGAGVGKNLLMVFAYLCGTVLSALAGYVGISIATIANLKAATAARESIQKSFMAGFRGGAVMGMAVCCFSKRMRKVFRKNEKSMLQNCNKKAKRKGRLQRVKKPM